MTRFALTFVACLALSLTAQAQQQQWRQLYPYHIGASAALSCQEFNALGEHEHDGALSWALGYISGGQEVIANQANKEQDIRSFDPLAAKSAEGARWFVRAITERCLKRPNEPFVNAIKCSWQKWLDVPPKGLCE